MRCRFCNKETPDGSKFCQHCGKNLYAVPGHPPVIRPAGNVPAAGKAPAAGNRTVKIAAIAAGVFLITVCAAGAGIFALRKAGESGGKEKEASIAQKGEERAGRPDGGTDAALEEGAGKKGREEKKAGNDGLEEYLTYIGMDIHELPDTFEQKAAVETQEFSLIQAEKEAAYAGIDGTVSFSGYELKESAGADLAENLPKEIECLVWSPKQQDEETIESVIQSINQRYGEYDGEAEHKFVNNWVDGDNGTTMLRYKLYYWSNCGQDNYDIELMDMHDVARCTTIGDGWSMRIIPCMGEEDSKYLNPLKKIQQACADQDAALMKDAFSEEFFASTSIGPEDMDELIEEIRGADVDVQVSFDVKSTEKIASPIRTMYLNLESGMGESVRIGWKEDIREVYCVQASLSQTVDGETEEVGELTLTIGKKSGIWKILYWETE